MVLIDLSSLVSVKMKSVVSYIKDLFAVRRLKALLYILLFLGLGELIRYLLDLPVAGNIIGMLLLFIALKQKWLRLSAIKPASDKLLEFLVLFFIPYGVGLMVYFDLVEAFWLPMTGAVIVSTLLTLYVTALIVDRFGR